MTTIVVTLEENTHSMWGNTHKYNFSLLFLYFFWKVAFCFFVGWSRKHRNGFLQKKVIFHKFVSEAFSFTIFLESCCYCCCCWNWVNRFTLGNSQNCCSMSSVREFDCRMLTESSVCPTISLRGLNVCVCVRAPVRVCVYRKEREREGRREK